MKKVMKKVICVVLFCFIILSASSVQAKNWLDLCNALGNAAEEVMKGRQTGVPMQSMIGALDMNSPLSKVFLTMITTAYEQPRFSTTKYQQAAIKDFKDSIFLACVKEHSK